MSKQQNTQVEEALATQIDASRKILLGLSNVGRLEEYSLGALQGLAVDQIRNAISQLGASRTYRIGRPLIELIIAVCQRDDVELATEIAEIVANMAGEGVLLPTLSALRTKPLKSFATEPPIRHTVFVDESGSAAWDEESQPVLTLVGVLVEDVKIPAFDSVVEDLLKEHGLPLNTEVHTQPILSNDGALKHLPPNKRFLFLRRFIELGLSHIVGFHYLGMLKPFVERKFRRKAAALGLDAYTTQVLYFNLTLQAACLGKIALQKYRYLFDRTDKYGGDIRSIISALKGDANNRLRLHSIAGDPQSVDSAQHRFVQLADVAGYFFSRHRQIEIRTFQPRAELLKHREAILDVYALMRPKLLQFVETALLIDWDALAEWSHPSKRRPRKETVVRLQPKQRDALADYFNRTADFIDTFEPVIERLEAGKQLTADELKQLRKAFDLMSLITDQVAQMFLRLGE